MLHRSMLQIMREGGYDPKGGKPIPVELIYESNTITYEEYQAEVERQRRVRQAGRNQGEIDNMELEAQILNDRALKAGVPKRFLEFVIDLTRIEDLNSGRGVYIHGKQGTYKTTTACSMLRGWLKDNTFGTAKFVRSTTLIDDFNDTYSSHETVAEVMGQYSTVGLLVIDDLGKEVPTARAISRIWELIDRRCGWPRPTIITSQLAPSDIADRLNSGGGTESALAIMRRLKESYILINMGE